MAQLIKERELAADEWIQPAAEAAATATTSPRDPDARLLLPLPDFLAAMAAGEPTHNRAVRLSPVDQDLEPLAPYLKQLPLVAISFASSGDGRGYTLGRWLRERYGYANDLRACGVIRVDQMFFLARCGFNEFDLAEGEDPQLAIAQLERFSVAYQEGTPGALTHPRRRYGR